jgi:hypothetical protein
MVAVSFVPFNMENIKQVHGASCVVRGSKEAGCCILPASLLNVDKELMWSKTEDEKTYTPQLIRSLTCTEGQEVRHGDIKGEASENTTFWSHVHVPRKKAMACSTARLLHPSPRLL